MLLGLPELRAAGLFQLRPEGSRDRGWGGSLWRASARRNLHGSLPEASRGIAGKGGTTSQICRVHARSFKGAGVEA